MEGSELYTIVLPDDMREASVEEAAAYWTENAVRDGWTPAGDPAVTREEPFMVRGDDGDLAPLFSDVTVLVRVQGPVVPTASMTPLPKARPDWHSVEAAAGVLAGYLTPFRDWETLPDGIQTHFTRIAEHMLGVAMPELTALILEHVAEHPTGFMLSPDEQDAISDVAELARAEVSPYGP